ncbi:MAG TPA: hypothetical protein VIM93_08845 [Kangiella sp.]
MTILCRFKKLTLSYLALFVFAFCQTSSFASEFEIDGELFEVNRINKHVIIASQAFGSTRINFGVVEGSDQVVLISSMMRQNAKAIEELVRHISAKPIKTVLVIDSDPFHHHGSSYFKDKGAIIIGHENLTAKEIAFDISFSDELVLDVGTETIRMTHSAAHSLDHAFITLENSGIVFAGDAIRNDWLIYAGENGWSAHIDALRDFVAKNPDTTLYVPGNRGQKVSSTVHELNGLLGIYERFSNLVQRLASKGNSAETIVNSHEVHDLIRVLERYEEFKPYLIHHVNDVLSVETF